MRKNNDAAFPHRHLPMAYKIVFIEVFPKIGHDLQAHKKE